MTVNDGDQSDDDADDDSADDHHNHDEWSTLAATVVSSMKILTKMIPVKVAISPSNPPIQGIGQSIGNVEIISTIAVILSRANALATECQDIRDG